MNTPPDGSIVLTGSNGVNKDFIRGLAQRAGWDVTEADERFWINGLRNAAAPFVRVLRWSKGESPSRSLTTRVLRRLSARARESNVGEIFELDDPVAFIQGNPIDADPSARRFHMIQLAATLTDQNQESILPKLAAKFLEGFPDGSVELYEIDSHFISRMFLPGKLAAGVAKFGRLISTKEEWEDTPWNSLWEFGSTPFQQRSPVNIGLAIATPIITGFTAFQRVSFISFHFGQTVSLREKYPSSLEAWWRPDPWPAELIRDQDSILPRHQASLFETPVDGSQWWDWYMTRVNDLMALLSSPEGFTSADEYDPIRHFKAVRTVSRIAEETHAITASSSDFERRYLTFDIVDQYANLAHPSDSAAQARRFGDMFAGPFVSDVRRAVLQSPLGESGAVAIDRWHDELFTVLVDGFRWDAPARTDERSVLQVLRDLRNARHGLFLTRDAVEERLLHHTGQLPARFSDWAVALWLWLLANPQFVCAGLQPAQ